MAIESVGMATLIPPQQTRLDQSAQAGQTDQSRQTNQARQANQASQQNAVNGTPEQQPPQPVVNAQGQLTGKVVNTVA